MNNHSSIYILKPIKAFRTFSKAIIITKTSPKTLDSTPIFVEKLLNKLLRLSPKDTKKKIYQTSFSFFKYFVYKDNDILTFFFTYF